MNRISLKEAVKFHGHLGPYLILGILAGESAVKKLGCEKYFGLEVKVWGANKKPKSCLIDGLQLSTGATYGKGNIHKFNGALIRIDFYNKSNNKRISLKLKDGLKERLEAAKTHKDAEILAKELYRTKHLELFDLTWRFQD
jgi:formylmethanofuran dehydrogenase subunit E